MNETLTFILERQHDIVMVTQDANVRSLHVCQFTPSCKVSWISKHETELNTTTRTRLIKQHGCEHMACSKGFWETMAYVIPYITQAKTVIL